MALICGLDEQWSFVGSKARQHWLWYAYNTKTGGYWPTLLVPVPMKPAGNYWHCLRHSTSA
ncbi:insertion element iso-IS1n protein insB [Shigella dysenteriae 1617]|nr:insertion element iso-IS1n protein insB [Shigella dysenteriae 1617]